MTTIEPIEAQVEKETISDAGMGAMGCGYNIFGKYADGNSKLDRLITYVPSKGMPNNFQETDYVIGADHVDSTTTTGRTQKEVEKSLSAQAKISGVIEAFSGGVSGAFNQTKSDSFTHNYLMIRKYHQYSIVQLPAVDIWDNESGLVISKDVKELLCSGDLEKIYGNYGRYFLTGGVYGVKVDVSCTVDLQEVKNKTNWSASAEASILGLFSSGASGSHTETDSSLNECSNLKLSASGGNASAANEISAMTSSSELSKLGEQWIELNKGIRGPDGSFENNVIKNSLIELIDFTEKPFREVYELLPMKNDAEFPCMISEDFRITQDFIDTLLPEDKTKYEDKVDQILPSGTPVSMNFRREYLKLRLEEISTRVPEQIRLKVPLMRPLKKGTDTASNDAGLSVYSPINEEGVIIGQAATFTGSDGHYMSGDVPVCLVVDQKQDCHSDTIQDIELQQRRMIASPVDWACIWRSKNKKSSVWKPESPDGFQAVGHIAILNSDKELSDDMHVSELSGYDIFNNFRCINEYYLSKGQLEETPIWSDRHLGGDMDVTLYRFGEDNEENVFTNTLFGVQQPVTLQKEEDINKDLTRNDDLNRQLREPSAAKPLPSGLRQQYNFNCAKVLNIDDLQIKID